MLRSGVRRHRRPPEETVLFGFSRMEFSHGLGRPRNGPDSQDRCVRVDPTHGRITQRDHWPERVCLRPNLLHPECVSAARVLFRLALGILPPQPSPCL
jgi:hypothetical protein